LPNGDAARGVVTRRSVGAITVPCTSAVTADRASTRDAMMRRVAGSLLRIEAVTLFVEDLERAKRFYEQAFAVAVHFEDADSVVFGFDGLLINLLREEAVPELIEPARMAPASAGARSVYTIAVDDVDERCRELAARGIALLNGPIDRPWGPRTASFQDPDGNIWELARA
jgi:catechol 2,3-dioxygenase-like lactoylglutathione lyase family enzyme